MTRGQRNSFSAIQIWCPAGSDHYLMDQWREQCDFDELQRQFARYFRRYRPSAILVESAANGHALISVMKRKHRKLIHEISPRGQRPRGFAGTSIRSWVTGFCYRKMPLGATNSLPNSWSSLNGGTLKGMLEGLEATMKSADANTTIVPGHGTLIRRDAIVPYRDMILAVAGKVEQMIAQGKSLQEVLAAKLTAPYDAKVAGGTESSVERFVSAVYQELKGGK